MIHKEGQNTKHLKTLTIDEAIAILDETLRELVNFPDEQQRDDFILDIVKNYQEKLNKASD